MTDGTAPAGRSPGTRALWLLAIVVTAMVTWAACAGPSACGLRTCTPPGASTVLRPRLAAAVAPLPALVATASTACAGAVALTWPSPR
jgi:hypothetical protein